MHSRVEPTQPDSDQSFMLTGRTDWNMSVYAVFWELKALSIWSLWAHAEDVSLDTCRIWSCFLAT